MAQRPVIHVNSLQGQTIESLGRQAIELPGSLWHGIDSVDAATGDEPCEFPYPYRLDAAHIAAGR